MAPKANNVSNRAPHIGIILCGGLGERFWPLSSEAKPKYALALAGKKTMLGATYDRLLRIHRPSDIFVSTGQNHAQLVKELLPMVPARQIIAEPLRRNTAGAVTLSTFTVSRLRGEGAILSFYPADALIRDEIMFASIMKCSRDFALTRGRIVLVGVRPTYPATGYGYVEAGKKFGPSPSPHAVKRFVEKPPLAAAKRLFRTKHFYWNAGIFTWQAAVFKNELRKHAADYFRAFRSALSAKTPSSAALLGVFKRIKPAPIDRLLIEKSDRLAVFPASFGWDDVGTWEALKRITPDTEGNVLRARGVFEAVRNTVIFCEDFTVVASGIEGLVIAQKGPFLLIYGPGRSQDIPRLKDAVLRRNKSKE